MLVASESPAQRLRITLRGAVQGVGFRPFVYRLATEMALTGWVLNSSSGLVVEVEGPPNQLKVFERRLEGERPKASVVTVRESARIPVENSTFFEIHASDADQGKSVNVLPDLATCDDCRRELFDPANQPNACPICGPKLEGTISAAAQALLCGEIVALKGIGGFQLLVDARQPEAVARLRQRKHREEKPFALMMPSLAIAREYCEMSVAEVELLESQAAPIVLVQPKPGTDIAWNVAHCSPYLGIMLPYSPLHHLLMQQCPFPLIATSGNRSDEPIATANDEARMRLKDIADYFLMHNRPIVRACDDSVVRLTRGRAGILRRARGYAPLGIRVARDLPPVLAVGGHLKNTVAIAVGRDVFLSQHIGDLETLEARQAFEKAIADLCRLYSFKPEAVVCDLHPDYASTHWAESSGLPISRVQHHQAHIAACAAENNVEAPYLGISWDGSGYGLDGAIWGGEFFRVEGNRCERVAHLRPFGLPGGDAAVREGWRSAASLLFEVLGKEQVLLQSKVTAVSDARIIYMLDRGLNVVPTTSVGRLFDAVASIAGLAHQNRFEGQAAMLLENEIGTLRTEEAYPLSSGDWAPLISGVVQDSRAGVPVPASRRDSTMH
jgi:hydrogenase maturation protein HypF